jgi:hypothetical protein
MKRTNRAANQIQFAIIVMKTNHILCNPSRVGTMLALIIGLTMGASHARDLGRGVGGAGAGVRPGAGVGGVGAGAARAATPAGVGHVGGVGPVGVGGPVAGVGAGARGVGIAPGVGVGAPGVGALPYGYHAAVPAGYATVAYAGYTCRYAAGVYYRAVTYQGQTVWVVVE